MAQPLRFHNISSLSVKDQTLFSRFGKGPTVVVHHRSVHEAFEYIVDANPLSTAARHDARSISYSDLDQNANRLANHLIQLGLKPKQRVCLVVQRSLEMLVGILAVLKAGCQYVPLDGGVVSEEGLQHTLQDTNATFALCLPKFENNVKELARSKIQIVCLGIGAEAHCPSHRPRMTVSPKDGAYAIYTSGIYSAHGERSES